MSRLNQAKIAIVTDWLTTYGGAEKVVKNISDIFPKAPIFTSQYSEKEVSWFVGKDVRTGWLNFFPSRFRKILGPLRNIYFSRLDLSEFDVVISICCAESKGVKTNSNQLHVSYLQGPPTQYYWGMYDDYITNSGFGKLNFLVRFFFKLLINPMRKKDYKIAQMPDFLIANSSYSQDEITKYYQRESSVIFPPVEIEKFKLEEKKEDYFISTSRQVNWKRLDLAVEVFKKNGLKLKLVGGGAEHQKLVKMAEGAENIEFIPPIQDVSELAKLVEGARGFIFPSLEPFGIAPIEALAAGTPVVALRKGGALDYIIEGKNGIFFDEQTAEALEKALSNFENTHFEARAISKTAHQFSEQNFKQIFAEFIEEKYAKK
ncbi:MAG: glycosyltransferase [bacterium]|nr:glycosyltransferase [bacterium]